MNRIKGPEGLLYFPNGSNLYCRSLREALEALLRWPEPNQAFLGRLAAKTAHVKRSVEPPTETHNCQRGAYWIRTQHSKKEWERLMRLAADAAGYEFTTSVDRVTAQLGKGFRYVRTGKIREWHRAS